MGKPVILHSLNLTKEMEKVQANCPNCPMRRKFEEKPNSFVGRFWRWHINFCPGWKQYFTSLPDEEREALSEKYDFHKY